MVGGEVSSSRVRCRRCTGIVRRLGGNVVILFFMHARTKGESYYVGGYAICWWERRTLSVVAHSVGYGGGGEKGSWCKLWGSVVQKGLRIKDEVGTTTVDAHVSNTKSRENTVRPLCSLALSMLWLVFVRTSFLRNPKKPGTFFADQRLYMYMFLCVYIYLCIYLCMLMNMCILLLHRYELMCTRVFVHLFIYCFNFTRDVTKCIVLVSIFISTTLSCNPFHI